MVKNSAVATGLCKTPSFMKSQKEMTAAFYIFINVHRGPVEFQLNKQMMMF